MFQTECEDSRMFLAVTVVVSFIKNNENWQSGEWYNACHIKHLILEPVQVLSVLMYIYWNTAWSLIYVEF